ncbi:molybdopterin cofactor-binding domain-containing protein, partial [Pseudomonadota bacterium]
VVMDVAVDDFGTISLKRATIAADAGQIVDPDGLTSQLEGGLIQSASWTLKEQVVFDPDGVTSRDWETYPILSFSEVPQVETILIDQPGFPYLGAGEATQGPTVAAIANAVYNAIGIRLRKIPFTPEQVREAAAG